MENISKQIAYLRGLMDGLEYDESSKEGRIFDGILNVLDEIDASIDDLYDYQDEIAEQVDIIDEDLAAIEEAQIKVLSEFLPAEVSKEEIEKAFIDTVAKLGLGKEKKNMGTLIKALKEVYPGADGKLISEVVREGLNN